MTDTVCSTRGQPVGTWRVLPPIDDAQIAELRGAGLAENAAITVDTIGAHATLRRLLQAERRRDGAVDFVLARTVLGQQVLLATLDVQATLAIIECETGRAVALLNQVERIQARRERNLSIAAVAFGAGTAVTTGALGLAGLAGAADILNILGGSAEGLSAGALFLPGPSGRLTLSQNLMEEIWRQPRNSLIFPPRVWRHLTRRPAPGAPNIIDELFAEWRETGLLPAEDGERTMVQIIAPSSRYSTDDLERRTALFDSLSNRVALMNRDLRFLLEEVTERALPASMTARRR